MSDQPRSLPDAELRHHIEATEVCKLEQQLHPEVLRRTIAEADKIELEARKAAIDLRRTEKNASRYLRDDLADACEDKRVLFHRMMESVGQSSCKTAMEKLSMWHRAFPGEPLTLQVCSPGGEIFPGYALIELMEAIVATGTELTTIGLGYVASMGGLLLQGASPGRRLLGRRSLMMIHQASSAAIGKADDIGDVADLLETLNEQAVQLFMEKGCKLTEDEFKARWLNNRKNWWIPAAEAIELGLADGYFTA
jgi:ATP-dependent protease ClpP protease subunit